MGLLCLQLWIYNQVQKKEQSVRSYYQPTITNYFYHQQLGGASGVFHEYNYGNKQVGRWGPYNCGEI